MSSLPKIQFYQENDNLYYTVGMYSEYQLPEIFYVRDPRKNFLNEGENPKLWEPLNRFAELVINSKGKILEQEVFKWVDKKYNGGETDIIYMWYALENPLKSTNKNFLTECRKIYKDEFPLVQVTAFSIFDLPYFFPASFFDIEGSYDLGLFPHKYNLRYNQFVQAIKKFCPNLTCTKLGTLSCSGCKEIKYCSVACSKIYWPCHKDYCTRKERAYHYWDMAKMNLPLLLIPGHLLNDIPCKEIGRMIYDLRSESEYLSTVSPYQGRNWMSTFTRGVNFVMEGSTLKERDYFIAHSMSIKKSVLLTDRPTIAGFIDKNRPHAPDRIILVIPLDIFRFTKDPEIFKLFFGHLYCNIDYLDTDQFQVFQMIDMGLSDGKNVPPWHPDANHPDPFKLLHPLVKENTIDQLKSSCGKPFCRSALFDEEDKLYCDGCKKIFYCSENCQLKDWFRHRSFCQKTFKQVLQEFSHDYTDIHEMD